MSNKTTKILMIIFAVGLVLRLLGITNAFPFIFHPDEPTIIRSALALRFDKNPGHFDWPHLYIYLNYFIYMVFSKIRDLLVVFNLKDTVYFTLPIIWDDKIIFYLITRLVTVIFGVGTIFTIYLSAKNLFNTKTGLLAAAAVALTPLNIWYSHYALADISMLFFASVALYYCTKILFVKNIGNYLMAGVFIGLSASTKYNGLLMALPLIIAHFLRIFSEKDEKLFRLETIENLIYSAITCILAFLLGTPYALLDFDTFTRTDGPKGALWQFTNVGNVDFPQRLKNFYDVIVIQFSKDFGYSFEILFIAAIIFLLIRIIKSRKIFEHKDLLFLVISSIILIFYMSGAEKTRSHYFFIVYPLIILAAAGFLELILEFTKFKYPKIVIILVFIAPLIFALKTTYIFYQEDSRVQFYKWLQLNYPKTTGLYYDGGDLSPLFENIKYTSHKMDKDIKIFAPGLLVLSDNVNDKFKLVKSFDNNLRKGPFINVYETF